MALNLTLRKTFLYIFATVGLVLIIIGTVSLINLGLRSYVFTKSDYPCYFDRYSMPAPVKEGDTELSEEEQEKRRQEQEKQCIEQRVSEKQRQASNAIAMLLVGIPLYGYHWYTIKKDNLV